MHGVSVVVNGAMYSMQNEYIQYGAWPTKEDVLKVIDQLRKLRGNNS